VAKPKRTVVNCLIAGSRGHEAVEFETAPDVPAALRWRAVLRRVDHVDLAQTDRMWTCRVAGVGHRLPVQRQIPLRVGLGLASLGVPMVVHQETRRW
jgi:hypothetical protein